MSFLLILALPLLIPVAIGAIVWACARLVSYDRELKKLRQDLDQLTSAVYGEKTDFSIPSPVRQTPPSAQPAPKPASQAASQPDERPAAKPAAQAAAQAATQAATQEPAKAASQPTFTQSAYFSAPTPAHARPSTPGQPEKPARTLETWLGRNVLGIVASMLVFIGLIFLGVLVYRNITDSIKILLMYTLSTLLTGLGVFLSVKKQNNFTLALTGCGCGSFFISILLTHVYFGKLPDFAAFGLLLLWMVATLFVARWQRSTLLSVVAHAGMIISLCFAFAQGISDEKLLLVLLYQVAASAAILVGNIFCCRKTYHFGVFASLFLTLIASGFMLARFVPPISVIDAIEGAHPFRSALSTPAIIAAFAIQFLMASVFSYLLSISASRIKNEETKIGLHFLNKLLWSVALCMNVYLVVRRLAFPHFAVAPDRAAAGIALLVCLIPLAIHVTLTLTMQIKLRFSQALECISVLSCFLLTSIFLMVFWVARMGGSGILPRLPWLIAPALALLFVRRVSRHSAYSIAANLLLGLDFLLVLCGGYGRLTAFGTPALALAWMLLYAAILVGQWYFQSPAARKHYSVLLRAVIYLLVLSSLIAILLAANLSYPAVTMLLILTGLHFLLLLLRYDREENGNTLQWLLGAASLVLLLIDAGCIAFAYRNSPLQTGLYFLLSVLAFFLAVVRAPRLFYHKDRPVQGALTGVVLTLLVLATVQGNTSWFSQSYILSLTCMLTALACILAGFIGKVGSLRFYGLILTLVCVLKLVTLDVVDLSTLLRVIALIGGGVICFIISALYNYTVKQLKQGKEKSSDFDHGKGDFT